MLQLLNKNKVKELEIITTPINNLLYDKTHFKLITKLHSFYYNDSKINTNTLLRKKLVGLLGKPSYYITYEFRNALWGFNFKDQNILLYFDERGFKLQVEKTFNIKLINDLYEYLFNEFKLM